MLQFLKRILGVVPEDQRDGAVLDEENPWKIEPIKDPSLFLRNLKLLGLENSVLYLEGTIEQEVHDFLAARAISDPLTIAVGTIWPRPDRHHIALTVGATDALADLADELKDDFLCTHIHVYRDQRVVLQWHDAFDGNTSIWILSDIPEPVVSSFAKGIGSRYSKLSDGDKLLNKVDASKIDE